MLRRARTAAWERLGHRGLFLILLGAYDLFYGLYLVQGGPLGHALLLPERDWGWAWIGCGAAVAAGGLRKRDGWAFALAALLKCVWAGEFFRLQYLGVPEQWIRGAYWLALALIVTAVSSWPEDDP